ncbi:MAG: 30S ribosomal protein S24e [Candidatus Heimdallarchaeaceae archaeon]
MKINIINKTENKLLDRLEIEAEVEHIGQPVPKREEFLSKLSALLNKERNQVVLIKMEAKYGVGKSIARVHVYDSAERAKVVEKKYLLKRSKIIEDKKE